MALSNGKWDVEDFTNIIPLVKSALRDYLKQGTDYAPGLDSEPTFLIKEGSGIAGDEPVYKTADVIFSDDNYEGNNYVRITVHGGDWVTPQRGTTIIPIRFLLDSGSKPEVGGQTLGADAETSDDILSSYVLRLVGTYEAAQELMQRGFHDVHARVERETRDNKTKIFSNPVSILCNIQIRGDS